MRANAHRTSAEQHVRLETGARRAHVAAAHRFETLCKCRRDEDGEVTMCGWVSFSTCLFPYLATIGSFVVYPGYLPRWSVYSKWFKGTSTPGNATNAQISSQPCDFTEPRLCHVDPQSSEPKRASLKNWFSQARLLLPPSVLVSQHGQRNSGQSYTLCTKTSRHWSGKCTATCDHLTS